MGKPDGSAIMSDNVRNFVGSHGFPDDLAEFEVSFLVIYFVSLIPAFSIQENSEVLSWFVNGYDVHYAKRVAGISSDFLVNFDHAFFVYHDSFYFLIIEGIFQSVL